VRRRAHALTVTALALGLGVACGSSDEACVGGCDSDLGRALFGPAAAADWTSFRNGPLRQGVSEGGVLGRSVAVEWQREGFLKLAYSAVKPSGAVWGDALYYPSDDGEMWAFDRRSGDPLWNRALSDHEKGIHGSPAAAKSVVWIGTYSGNLHALDPESGREIYGIRPGRWIGSSPVYAPEDNALFVSHETLGSGGSGAGFVTRNDPRTGEEIWRSEVQDDYIHSSVAVDAEAGLVFVGANDGVIFAMDTETGDTVWSRDFEPEPDSSAADIKTTPAVSPARDLVVVPTWDGSVYGLRRRTGKTVWQTRVGGAFMGSAAIHESTGRVYLGTPLRRDALLALDLETGEVQWRLDVEGGIQGSPAVNGAGDGLVVGSDSGMLWGVDARTGDAVWSFTADGPLTASPTWVRDRIYFAAKEGSLYALQVIPD